MIPESERLYHEQAAAELVRREEDWKPKAPEGMLAELRVVSRQAREVLRDAPDLVAHLAARARARHPGVGSPTVSEAAVFRMGYAECLADLRGLSEWEEPKDG